MLSDEKINGSMTVSLISSGANPDVLRAFARAIERAMIEQYQDKRGVVDATGRTPQDYAIEHAEYLATSAEQLLNHLNECTNIEDGVIEPDEHYSDYTSGLRVAIHDFRKRRDRAKAMPAPKQEPFKWVLFWTYEYGAPVFNYGLYDTKEKAIESGESGGGGFEVYPVFLGLPPQAAAIPESVLSSMQEFLQKNKLCMACYDDGFIFYRWDSTRNRSSGLQKTAWTVEEVMELIPSLSSAPKPEGE